MDTDTAETKVQIRLTTRDPGLQISDEPSTLLVQTCKYRREMACAVRSCIAVYGRALLFKCGRDMLLRAHLVILRIVLTECASSFNAPQALNTGK